MRILRREEIKGKGNIGIALYIIIYNRVFKIQKDQGW